MKSILLAFFALLLFSVNASAQFIWQKTYGPFNNMYLSKMIALKNGDYLLAGNQYALATGNTTYSLRTNANGDTIWTRKYKPLNMVFSIIYDAVEDVDGNLILVGAGHAGNTSNYNGFLYKVNPNGDTLWTKKIITPQRDSFHNIIIGHDNSYLVAVQTAGGNYIRKYTKHGALVWNKISPFSSTDPGRVGYLHKAQSGYFVFVNSDGNAINLETKIYKIDENGNEQYTKKNKMFTIYDIVTDNKQNLLVCSEGRLFKLNPTGDTIWSKIYKRNDKFIGIDAARPTTDGNYILLFGTSGYRDIGFMKVNFKGVVIKDTVLYRGGMYDSDYGKDIVLDNNDNYVFAGYSGVQNGQVYFLCKYRKWNQVIDTGDVEDEKELVSGTNLYPNPATTQTTLISEDSLIGTFTLYDLQGQKLWQETVTNSTEKVIPMHSFSRGVYILKFYSENGSNFTRKVVKQ